MVLFSFILTIIKAQQLFFVLVIIVISITLQKVVKADDSNDCLDTGPPYIFATVHHEIKNILKYSIDQRCLISSDVLQGHHFAIDTELRSMAWGQYKGIKALFIADASALNSQILIYTPCDKDDKSTRQRRMSSSSSSSSTTISTSSSFSSSSSSSSSSSFRPNQKNTTTLIQQEDEQQQQQQQQQQHHKLNSNSHALCYERTAVSNFYNPGVDHSYGITFDDEFNLYGSFQHTNSVLRFEKDTYFPMQINSEFNNNRNFQEYFQGTFAQFGEPEAAFKLERGVRAILYVNGNIWIANEDLEGIIIMSVKTGRTISIIMLNSPIGLYRPPYNSNGRRNNIVYASTKSHRFGGAVYGINVNTFEPLPGVVYRNKKMKHPTGMTSYRGVLYVAEQYANNIHMFDIESGENLGKLITSKDIPGSIEQILLSDI